MTLPTGVRIRYRRAGRGDAILLLHGIAHSLRAWDRVIVPLAEHNDVIAVDLPGCGASDKPDTDYSLGSQATAIRYVLESLGLDMVTAIGHSLGGGVAMTLAYQYPELVGRLGLIASGGLGRELHAMFRLASLPLGPAEVMRLAFSPRTRLLRRLLATQCGAPLFARPHEHREDTIDILRALEDPDARRAFLRMLRSASSIGGQAISALDRIGLALFPVLIVWGRQDGIFPVAHAERAAALIPNARLVVLEECGHFPQIEATAGLLAALTSWLSETKPQRIGVGALLAAAGQAPN
ncbi:MAG: alpha/beta fold hydrolase [Candidatus Dormiibacterota bacterium]